MRMEKLVGYWTEAQEAIVRHWAIVNLVLAVLVFGCGDTTETQVIPDDTPSPSDGGTSDSGTTNPDGTIGEDSSMPTGNDPNNCEFSMSIQNPGGKLHSEPCETDAECIYGLCHSSPGVANFKFCTKNPYCGPGTECSSDNSNGKTFMAQLSTNSDGNETAKNICTQQCVSVEDCPSGYTACETVKGVNKTCTAK